MSRTDLICLGIILIGGFLFLIGANFYNELIGWTGVVMFVGGIIALIVFYFFNWFIGQKNQKP